MVVSEIVYIFATSYGCGLYDFAECLKKRYFTNYNIKVMKKLLLMKTMLLLCALIVGSSSVWAGTITFSELGLENSVQYLDPFDGGDFTVTFAGGSNDGKYYNTGAGVRVYGNGTMTIAAKSGNLTQIVITYDGSNKPTTNDVVNVGTYNNSTGTWTGEAASVVFTRPSGSGHWRVKTITATVSGGSTPTCATPKFSPDGGVYTSTQNVTISTETDGATIYYTTDGSTPTNESTVYGSPISVSTTATLKAIAVKDGSYDSSVATASYLVLGHAGTESDPYTVADARAAIDANIGITSVYATGIVSEIVTAWDSDHKNISFNISTDGSTTSDQLQAYRCVSSTTADASTVQVGDIVIISGNLVKFGSTYEFAQGNELVSLTPDPRVAATLSWSASEVEINKGATDSEYTLPTLNNPQSVSPITYTITGTDDLAIEVDGDILVDTDVEGSVTVTASFAGNATYKPANASYTITVVDKTKKGTIYNPYTVAEVLSLSSKPIDVYVEGYIVGFVTGTTSFTSAPTTGNVSNWAIADDKNETAFANVIPVEIKTANQTNYAVGTHPEFIGAKVLIMGDIMTYFSKNGVKNLGEINVEIPVTVSSAGLATFASNSKLDFTNVENLEAYIAKENGSTIELHKVNKVPAETGVLLRAKNDATDFNVPVTTAAADDVAGNIFVRGTGAAVATGEGPYNYVLGKHDGVVGFYKAGGMVVATNKAYLQTTIAAARIDVNFDETTALTLVNSEKRTVNSDVFDLQGRKVANPTKGLYIVNGKKVVVK